MPVITVRRKCPESRNSLLVLVPVTPGPRTRKCCTWGPRDSANFIWEVLA